MISITKAGPNDVHVLSEVGGITLIESHGHSAPSHVMKAYVAEKFSEQWLAEELSDAGNIFHLIHYDGKPVGYSKIVYNIAIDPVQESNITKMERLYVLQQFHDYKVGRQLMDFNIELSKQNSQQGMWLYVWKENQRALRFYQNTGFKIVGDGLFRLTEDHANPNWQMFLQY